MGGSNSVLKDVIKTEDKLIKREPRHKIKKEVADDGLKQEDCPLIFKK